MLVILALVAYPAVYHLLTNSPVANLAVAVLPRMDSMVAVLYFALFAMSFDFISGYTGYLSFGHAAFYGTGAYVVILIANGKVPLLPPGTPFVVSLLIAAVLAALLAVVIGLVSFRLTGVYFAMITLGFAQVMYVFVRGWDYVASNPRDGPAVGSTHAEGFGIGIPFVDQLNLAIGSFTGDTVTLLGHELGTYTVSFYMVGLVVLLSYFAMQRVIHSPFGRVMIAIRENEERAEAIGYDTFRYKLGAFVMSAFFGGVAGALFAGFRRSVTPENTFYFLVTGDALLASIIGGFGTLAGPLYGHLFDHGVREFLSNRGQGGGLLPYLQETLSEGLLTTQLPGGISVQGFIQAALNGHASLYVGIVFVLVVLYVPSGILGTVRSRLGGKLSETLPARVWGDR
ncbi:branched-chain amino acid ABC transporter permease [Halosimplex salinum]|uniref:branched-chain amino acid ABC transporter permease n=1 Tax=Halosimplex salinum TaxID=1710538 RepID=UPI000F47C015|nr:branched-chain amino acid ABC transporter permease [Halosimplex salinum]